MKKWDRGVKKMEGGVLWWLVVGEGKRLPQMVPQPCEYRFLGMERKERKKARPPYQ